MSLPIEKFLFEIELPKQYFNADFDIYDRFKAEAEHFLNLYSMCDGNEFPEEKKTKIQEAFSKTLDIIQRVMYNNIVINELDNNDISTQTQNKTNRYEKIRKNKE